VPKQINIKIRTNRKQSNSLKKISKTVSQSNLKFKYVNGKRNKTNHTHEKQDQYQSNLSGASINKVNRCMKQYSFFSDLPKSHGFQSFSTCMSMKTSYTLHSGIIVTITSENQWCYYFKVWADWVIKWFARGPTKHKSVFQETCRLFKTFHNQLKNINFCYVFNIMYYEKKEAMTFMPV